MRHLSAHASEITMSVVSVGEIVFGARRVPGGQRYLQFLRDDLLPHVPVLDVDVAVATQYGELRAMLERSGQPLPDLDLLIAATAQVHELSLVTGNRRHFTRIPELDLPDWFGDGSLRWR